MAIWFTADYLERAHGALPELPVENEDLAGMLLDVAREQVLEYAADDEPGVQVTDLLHNLGVEDAKIAQVITLLDFEASTPGVPTRYVYAQLMQAKNLWLAGKGEDGPEGFTFSPRPLSKDIQRVIRPTSGVASVF
ncbi:hypothetical protein HMPREF1529_02680 [Microbacterium sp. oral taxon 186 str. F0373]|uniref:hypothetical protein n=1 Tax=Microbacterium TaxID=33882 RepID=UPI00034E165C|nr:MULTISPECIES: hypothetical protein [Microbacterium]EPD83304.1 hypothetical protein HMPREF1529_02680 [Microbacterium sp. oral taxon 186 str. F0373]QOC24787.1 hypothetical protein IC745_10355 [Microbacterium hominis]QOC28841.1 hypothetical protein IC744_16110 [Microbacterium hominis]QYF98115.1 hypothetical protein KY498_02340 [Microbacterium sp. PAMC21962]